MAYSDYMTNTAAMPGGGLMNQGGTSGRMFSNNAAKSARGGRNTQGSMPAAPRAGTSSTPRATTSAAPQGGRGRPFHEEKAPKPTTPLVPGYKWVYNRFRNIWYAALVNPSAVKPPTDWGMQGDTTGKPMVEPKPGYEWVSDGHQWAQQRKPRPVEGPQPGYEWVFVEGTGWTQRLIGGIDPRDHIYDRAIANAAFTRDTAFAQINPQFALNAASYNLYNSKRMSDYRRNLYDTNASLAGRGLFRGGARRSAQQARDEANNAEQLRLDQQYGSIANAALQAKLEEAKQAFLFAQATELQAAIERHKDMYPASVDVGKLLASITGGSS